MRRKKSRSLSQTWVKKALPHTKSNDLDVIKLYMVHSSSEATWKQRPRKITTKAPLAEKFTPESAFR